MAVAVGSEEREIEKSEKEKEEAEKKRLREKKALLGRVRIGKSEGGTIQGAANGFFPAAHPLSFGPQIPIPDDRAHQIHDRGIS